MVVVTGASASPSTSPTPPTGVCGAGTVLGTDQTTCVLDCPDGACLVLHASARGRRSGAALLCDPCINTTCGNLSGSSATNGTTQAGGAGLGPAPAGCPACPVNCNTPNVYTNLSTTEIEGDACGVPLWLLLLAVLLAVLCLLLAHTLLRRKRRAGPPPRKSSQLIAVAPAPEPAMSPHVTVHTVRGQQLRIRCDPKDTVDTLRAKIRDHVGVEPARQELALVSNPGGHGGNGNVERRQARSAQGSAAVLHPSSTLVKAGVVDGSHVRMTIAKPPAPPAAAEHEPALDTGSASEVAAPAVKTGAGRTIVGTAEVPTTGASGRNKAFESAATARIAARRQAKNRRGKAGRKVSVSANGVDIEILGDKITVVAPPGDAAVAGAPAPAPPAAATAGGDSAKAGAENPPAYDQVAPLDPKFKVKPAARKRQPKVAAPPPTRPKPKRRTSQESKGPAEREKKPVPGGGLPKRFESVADAEGFLSKLFRGSMITITGNVFQIVLADGRKHFIKYAGGQLIIRVGGGWETLKRWLAEHNYALGDDAGATRGRKQNTKDTDPGKNAQYDSIKAEVMANGGSLKGRELGSKRGPKEKRTDMALDKKSSRLG